jgi:hypothetical protein
MSLFASPQSQANIRCFSAELSMSESTGAVNVVAASRDMFPSRGDCVNEDNFTS